MDLGTYDIETYYVVINNKSEKRQRIIYKHSNGIDFIIENYRGTIRDGYIKNISFKDLTFNSIRTHIAGESLVINDNSTNPNPLIYLSISTIESIQMVSDLKLNIIDTRFDPISLEFITKSDCDQAYSILNYLLQNPLLDINSIGLDNTPPEIFFNEYFYGEPITLNSTSGTGPFSSSNGENFIIDIKLESFEGPFPLIKSDITDGLIYNIVDNRDNDILISEEYIVIYRDIISSDTEVDSITEPGAYIVSIYVQDLVQNQAKLIVLVTVS